MILSRRPAWPISVLLIGYPLWWALGFGDLIWIILAVPMAVRMIGWRVKRTRSFRVPPAFGLWLVFLLLAVIGGTALGLTAPGTATSPLSHRVLSYLNRTGSYVAITVLLLYACNLTETELPRRRLAWMLGLVAIYTTLGGVAAIIKPTFQFSSLLEVLLPHHLQNNAFVHALTHPGLAQVQGGLGGAGKRPKAPFDYTNAWGESLTLLVPWLIVGWWYAGTRRRRILVAFLVALAAVALLYSLNRTAWVGAAVSVVYVVVRLVAKRPRALITVLCAGVVAAGVVAVATPVPSLLAKRLSTGGSAGLRSSLDGLAVKAGVSSPVIGYGDTRKQLGSLQSVARGPTSDCPKCGQQAVGSTGQLWLLLICNGAVGAVVYIGFFAVGMWRFRRDRTPYGQAGVLVLGLSLLYLFTYEALSAPLGFTMLGYALLLRNEIDRGRLGRTPAEVTHSTRQSRSLTMTSPAPRRRSHPRIHAVEADSGHPPQGRAEAERTSSTATRHRELSGEGAARRAPTGSLAGSISGTARDDSRAGRVSNTADLPGSEAFVQQPAQRQPRDAAEIPAVARGSVLNLAGAAFFAAATLGVTVLVTREFSRQVAGAFFTATSLFLIVETAAGLGAYAGLVYFIARLQSTGSERRIGETLRRAILPVVVASIAAALAMIVFAKPLARAMLTGHQSSGVSASDVAVALRALAAALPFAALLDTLLGATRGYGDMRPTAAINGVGLSVLQLLGALIAALLGAAALLAPLWALAYIPAAMAAWLRLRRIRSAKVGDAGPQRGASGVSVANPSAFWRFTAPRALANAGRILIQRLDIVLVAIIRGPVDAAIYTAATRFLVLGQMGNVAISMAAQPQLSERFGRGDRAGAGAIYQATTAWLVLLTWPLYLLVINFGPAILSIFGHSYRTGSGVMVILGASALLASACGQVDVVLTSTGRTILTLANALVALAVNVGVDLALIPRYGITGAAIGWAAAIVASNLIPLVQLARIVRIHPFGAATLLAGALTGVSFGLIPALTRAVFGGGAAVQAAAVATGCAVLAAGLWRWRERLQLSMMPRPGVHRWFSPSGFTEGPSSPKIT